MKYWITLLALAFTSNLLADDFGITPADTHALVTQQPDKVLFIDVRDPVEIMFIGHPQGADANIPFLLVDRFDFDEQNTRFRLNQNPDFAASVDAALAAKGLDRSAPVITICRSGSERGEPSASFLREQGFADVRYVINGFQGSSRKEAPQQGMRTENGWQNEGLPWSARINPETIFRP
ncbi:MAG: rhodanese-like domain-containing protein [Halopseudomonas yangmingensis]